MSTQEGLNLSCSEFEILLADYVDGTLDPVRREALENHRKACAGCAELAADVVGVVAFMDRVEEVAPPPELLAKIAFHIPTNQREGLKARSWKDWFGGWMRPVLQPKFAMGMAMTILSFSMLGRFAGIAPRQLKPADLHPVKVWEAADDRLNRAWVRAVKYYESLRIVYEVRSRLNEWSQQEEEERRLQATPGAQAPAGNEGKKEAVGVKK